MSNHEIARLLSAESAAYRKYKNALEEVPPRFLWQLFVSDMDPTLKKLWAEYVAARMATNELREREYAGSFPMTDD